jgi:hypothetical protein
LLYFIHRFTVEGLLSRIIKFMLTNSRLEDEKAKAKPATYSTIRSTQIGRPSPAVMAAAKMIPVRSPAMQWIVEPSPCFQRDFV